MIDRKLDFEFIAFVEPEAKILLDAQEKDVDYSESDSGEKTEHDKSLGNEAELVDEGVDVDEQFEGLALQESCEVEEEVG